MSSIPSSIYLLTKVLQWLQKETVVRVKHDFRTIGGPDSVSPQMLGTCFDRMMQWVELAKETLEAEWPSFEAVRAFSVFQLRPKLSVDIIKQDLTKIAHIFNEVDQLPVLLRSFLDCQYTASKRRSMDETNYFKDLKTFHLGTIFEKSWPTKNDFKAKLTLMMSLPRRSHV